MAFLQRPGGIGPAQNLKPLGGLAAVTTPLPPPPAHYRSSFSAATGLSSIDNVNRVIAQYEKDNGTYNRAAVDPTYYQQGNIVPSTEPVGVAGYNHQGEFVTPGKAADLTDTQYLLMESNNLNPGMRAEVAMATAVPQQNFFNAQEPSNYPLVNYNMPDNLYMPGAVTPETKGE